MGKLSTSSVEVLQEAERKQQLRRKAERKKHTATLLFYRREQQKRREAFRLRERKAAASQADFRADVPGATGVRRGLDARRMLQAEFEGKLAARGKTPGKQKRLRAALRDATSASDLLAQVRGFRNCDYLEGVYRSAHNSYAKACALIGCSSFTYSMEGLVALACIYVDAWKNKSSGLSDLFTRLNKFAVAAERKWITADEQAELRSIRLMLERQFPCITVGAKALTWVELDPLLARLQPRAERGDVYAAQVVAMMLLAHECMMRGTEYLERALLVEDIRLVEAGPLSGDGGIIAITYLAKMRKSNHDERDDLRIAVARPTEPHRCARRAMRIYLQLANLKAEDVIFPWRASNGEIKVHKAGEREGGFTYSQFTALLRKELALAGVKNAEDFVARSMRAGGHTDYAAEGMDVRVIGMVGGWKTAQAQSRYMRLAMAGLKALSRSR